VLSTIGIGSGASSELVTRLAQAGGGMHDMLQNEHMIAATVIKQLKISKSHRLSQFSFQCNGGVFNLSKNNPSVFEGDWVNLYTMLPLNTVLSGQAVLSIDGRIAFAVDMGGIQFVRSHVHHKVF